MQGQHPHHSKCSPGTRWELGLLSAAELVSLPGHSFVGWYCGIVALFAKGHLHHLLQELVRLCPGCPCAV